MSQAKPQPGPSDESIDTILVVEDEVLVRLSVAEYLRDCGFRVFEANNVAEAKTVLNTETRVDLVFSDVNLPGKQNGFMLASWVHEHHPNIPVLLTSGIPDAVKKASDLCDDGPLPKPYTHAAVLQRIQALLHEANKRNA